MTACEANFDGLVGPTHNYAGLSWGNVASQTNVEGESNPREAALQGLKKIKDLADRGFVQGVLPPHERPHLPTLRALGFRGNDAEVLEQVARQAPQLLAAVSSASNMWTANAATVSPSADTCDGKVHFTPANLNSKFHRSIEHGTTSRILQRIFPDPQHFIHHPALPSVSHFADEGAANHSRFCGRYGDPGVELFVYGRMAFNDSAPRPEKYPARQTLEASQAIARLHGLNPERVIFAQQNPRAVDAGVFHNDVIAVANGPVLFYHEHAFLNEAQVIEELREKLRESHLIPIRVPAEAVSVTQAVQSYLFNSQLLSHPDGTMTLAVPGECRENEAVSRYLDSVLAGANPIAEIVVFNLQQSMCNGGGPACLRLRVVLTEAERQATHQGVLMTDRLYDELYAWAKRYYRERLVPADLADIRLLQESQAALGELTDILGLGQIYEFQQGK